VRNNSDNNSIRFRLLGVETLRLAIAEELITTIVDWTEPAPVPFGPKALLGVVCIQGRMFTVLNLVKLLHPEQNESNTTTRSILALRGDEQLALAVDTAEYSVELPAMTLEPTSTALTSGSIEYEGSSWQILNVDELFNALVQGRERRRRRS
jgi:chemotaxis signal transduction protein